MNEPSNIELAAACLYALKIAVDEAEDWFDDSRGLQQGERIPSLSPCYSLLDAADIKTARETKGK